MAGEMLAAVGDVNGDGYDDFLISAYYADQTYLIYGRESGWPTSAVLNSA